MGMEEPPSVPPKTPLLAKCCDAQFQSQPIARRDILALAATPPVTPAVIPSCPGSGLSPLPFHDQCLGAAATRYHRVGRKAVLRQPGTESQDAAELQDLFPHVGSAVLGTAVGATGCPACPLRSS